MSVFACECHEDDSYCRINIKKTRFPKLLSKPGLTKCRYSRIILCLRTEEKNCMDSNLNLFHFSVSVICIQLSFIVGSINKCALVNCCCVEKQVKIAFILESTY
jgi:hypothetical protein